MEEKESKNKEDLNNLDYIIPFRGGKMKKVTRNLLLSACGGALLILGLLAFYNMLSINNNVYGFFALIFFVVGVISLKKAFQ